MRKTLFAPLAAALLSLAACTSGEQPLPPLPAEIIGVEVTPEPVAPLDTAVFRVLTSRKALVTTWTLSDGRSKSGSSDTVRWVAPAEAGLYEHSVSISEILVTLDRETFSVEVSDD